MTNYGLKEKQQGLTLIEIMIALVLGVFLLGGILKIFLSSNQTYRMQDNMSRLQENGRFAMDFISRDIRMAGLRTGCLKESVLVPAAIAGTNNDGLNGSDTIITQISVAACPVPPAVLTVITTVYSVAAGASGESALFRSIGGVNQELVEGIEDMQILYGEDTDDDNTPNYYVEAGTVGLDMEKVVSIRMTLTARTLDNNLTSTGDGRLRRTFSSTIAVRNRLP